MVVEVVVVVFVVAVFWNACWCSCCCCGSSRAHTQGDQNIIQAKPGVQGIRVPDTTLPPRWDAAHPSRDLPNTSRRFGLGSDACLVGENPACSVPALYGETTTAMHDNEPPPSPPPAMISWRALLFLVVLFFCLTLTHVFLSSALYGSRGNSRMVWIPRRLQYLRDLRTAPDCSHILGYRLVMGICVRPCQNKFLLAMRHRNTFIVLYLLC